MRRATLSAVAVLACWAAPSAALAQAPVDPGPLLNPVLELTGQPSQITAVPNERYAPDMTIDVSRARGLHYVNLDQAFHDVVALDAKRPHKSAPWCAYFPPDPDDPEKLTCPLFWTPLKPGAATDPSLLTDGRAEAMVQGLADAQLGATYKFYCSIHPLMVGTIRIVA